MKLDDLTPHGAQQLYAGLHPEKTYLVQSRRWAVWMLRGILVASLALGALALLAR